MNVLNHLLVDLESFDRLPTEKLEDIGLAANDLGMTISHGIAAIGLILAGAAKNDDVGLNVDAVADLGYLLQSLGKLSSHAANIEGRADTHSRYRSIKKGA
ncbi:hypothetical protein [Pseudomonas sp.]|uniref:hypothetical protein n=1 Tax=Pseudomonas sp. TaxID=306 RepID=UPI003FD7FA4D